MAMEVEQQVRISFKVNNIDIPIGLGSFKELSIIESTTQKVPTLQIVFKDPDNSLHDLVQLVDGAKMAVVLHSDNGFDLEGPYETTFICMGSNAKIQGGSLLFKSSGVYDSAKFLGGVVKKAVKGTSAEVVSQLAGEVNLKPEVLKNANDKMVWMPSRQTYADFIRTIINHGRASEKTITSMAVDTYGTLHYKDLSDAIGKPVVRKAISGPPTLVKQGVIPVIGYEILDMSGMYNFMYNHGTKLVQEKMTGQSEDFLSSAISMGSNFLSINTGIRDAIGGIVRSEFLPADTGNCQTGDTLIPTENGILRLDQICSPKELIKERFEPINLKVGSRYKPAKAKSWVYNGIKPTLKIETETGHRQHITYSHPNLVFNPDEGLIEWKLAKTCKINDMLCINPIQITRKKTLQLNLCDYDTKHGFLSSAVKKPTVMTPDLASLMAYIIAEGNFTRNRYTCFHNSNDTLLADFEYKMIKVFGLNSIRYLSDRAGMLKTINGVSTIIRKHCYTTTVCSVILRHYLDQLGIADKLSADKEIPWSILQADKKSQYAFLASYLEGDGSIDNKTGRIVYYSTSHKLLQTILVMLNSHGITGKLRPMKTCYGLTLNQSQSSKLWLRIKDYMVHKHLNIRNYESDKEGVPSHYWIKLLKSREIKLKGKRKADGMFYLTDDGKIVNFKWKDLGCQSLINTILRGSKQFLYRHYRSKALDPFLSKLKLVSKQAYAKLVYILKLEYKFTKIKSISDGGRHPVYDLSMGKGVEPAFIANGLVVHNTHEKYYEAEYQNRKGRGTFSNRIEFVTTCATGLKLYDNVYFEPTLPTNNKISELWSGNYMVSAKTKFLGNGAQYYEKIRAVSQGYGSNYGGSLLGASS